MKQIPKPEPQKKILVLVVILFILSTSLLIYGLTKSGIKESETESSIVPVNEVVGENEDGSLIEYFDDVPLTSGKENSELYYMETDPFKEKCAEEGGTFGTRCYY